jgi:hypothetical protein
VVKLPINGQEYLGPSKFAKVVYKTLVALDSSDDDWV